MITKTYQTIFLTAVLAVCSCRELSASITVNYNAAPGSRDVVAADGATLLENDNEVRIGFFNGLTDQDVRDNADGTLAGLQTLGGAWTQFDSTLIKNVGGEDGRYADGLSKTDATFDNQKVFVWIFRVSGVDKSVAGDYSNVDEYGIFSSTAANWIFPVEGSLPGDDTTTVISSEVDDVFFGSLVGAPDTGSLSLAAVPEPRDFGLVAGIGLIGFVLVRKRFRLRYS